MHQKGVLNDGEEIVYAFGLGHGEHRGLPTVGHSGGDAGFRSRLVRYPDQPFTVAVLSNLGSFNPSGIAGQVAEIFLASEMEAAESRAGEENETAEEEATGEFSLDPATLDDYVGDFLLDGGLVISLTRDGGRLMAAAPGQPPLVLWPESEGVFELREISGRVTFHRDDSGGVSQFTLLQGTQESVAERMELAELTPEEMGEFEGEYYSPELGTMYTVVAEEGELTANHRRHGKIELTSTSVDEFIGNAWYFGTVRFERDEEDKVVMMFVSSGRVRDVRFERMSD